MDKDWKLQRYGRKDYSEIVDFPVEIVGRDGVVRRYSFEDSIRLYQRRITFAGIRYREAELVEAESHHCRSRIDQLRRSFFHRFGWGTPEDGEDPIEVFGDIAGEIAAFLCRVLRSGEHRPEVSVLAVDSLGEAVSTWYVTPTNRDSGMILYVHQFELGEPDSQREQFFDALKVHERNTRLVCDGEADGERLVAFHHTVDCGFILTGRGDEFAEFGSWNSPSDEAQPDLTPTPWDELLKTIRRGRYDEALTRCRELVEAQPWHRQAYVAGAVLATFLGRPLAAEDIALVGTRYFPEDASLAFQLALARQRQGRRNEAMEPARLAVSLDPCFVSARLLLILLEIEQGSHSSALKAALAMPEKGCNDRRGAALVRSLIPWLRWRQWLVAGGVLVVLAGLLGVALVGWPALFPVLSGVILLVGGEGGFRWQLARLMKRRRLDDVELGLRRLSRAPSRAGGSGGGVC